MASSQRLASAGSQKLASALAKTAARPTKTDDEPIFLDPSDDPTFQSLKKLLSAPSTSTQHLSLLSESTLYGSITYYLSKLQLEHVAEFAGVISSSGCLWTPPPPTGEPPKAEGSKKVTWTTDPGSSSTSAAKDTPSSSDKSQGNPSPLSGFLISRSTSVSQAVAAALSKRVDLIVRSKKNSTGWASRSALSQYLGAVIRGMDETERDAVPESYKAARGLPIPRFAIIGGLLNSLYVLKDQRKRMRDMSILEEMAAVRANPSLGLSIRRQLNTVEDEWIVTLAEILDHLHGSASSPASSSAGEPDSVSSQKDRGETEQEVDEWEAEFRKRTAQVTGPAEITSLAPKHKLQAALRQVRDVPLYMAAQLAPFVPDRKIHALDPVQLTTATSDAILSLFEGPERSSLISNLASETHVDSDKVHVKADGSTANLLRGVTDSTLFPLLGPLSKLMSRALAKAVTSLTPDQLSSMLLGTSDASLVPQVGEAEFFPLLVRMSRLASHLESSWLATALAGASEDQIADTSKQLTKQLWTVFKTLLFSYTMVFDSMMDALVDMCPSPTLTIPAAVVSETEEPVQVAKKRKWPQASTSNLPTPYLMIVQMVLATFSHLYWITSTFGSDGFDVYRKVFYSALDVLGRDGEACIQLLELISPVNPTSPGTPVSMDGLELNSAKRSFTTYFLNVAEQLIPTLPDEFIEQLILPISRPYLEDTRFSDTFESAHSVVLALYSNGKRCTLNLAPFYVDLLIRSYPGRLTAEQLEYAMGTVVGAVSDRSDSIAWWVITQLVEEIDRERMTAGGGGEKEIQSGGFAEDNSGVSRQDVADAVGVSETTHPSEPNVVSQKDANPPDTYDRLTHLQLCLISCIPSVNLVLLRSALNKVEAYILQHKQRSDGGSTLALCQKTFDAIQAFNASTREEGLRWWLDNRDKFGV